MFDGRVSAYLVALVFTIAIEGPAYAALLSLFGTVPWRGGFTLGALVNIVSHPVAFLVIAPLLTPGVGWIPALLLAEIAVVGLEAALVSAYVRRQPASLLGISYLANALSLAVGLVLLS